MRGPRFAFSGFAAVAACALVGVCTVAGCGPVTTAEAESRGDVGWLERSGTPDAMAALGRVADRDPRASAALERHPDANAYRAAWQAVVRGAPWGMTMLRQGLADPIRANAAATGMGRGDPRALAFMPELEDALEKSSMGGRADGIAATLASLGTPAHDAVARRLNDPATRDAMCMGLGSPDVARDARSWLLDGPPDTRDAPGCVAAILSSAASDDGPLTWLAQRGEPGLLGAAGKETTLSCARLTRLWSIAFSSRDGGSPTASALAVPLMRAITRCTREMDAVTADALLHRPPMRELIVSAVDPWGHYQGALRTTCAALWAIPMARETQAVRERAADARQHTCAAGG